MLSTDEPSQSLSERLVLLPMHCTRSSMCERTASLPPMSEWGPPTAGHHHVDPASATGMMPAFTQASCASVMLW